MKINQKRAPEEKLKTIHQVDKVKDSKCGPSVCITTKCDVIPSTCPPPFVNIQSCGIMASVSTLEARILKILKFRLRELDIDNATTHLAYITPPTDLSKFPLN